MPDQPAQDLTLLLKGWSEGNEEAGARVFSLVYDELHRIAARSFRSERHGHTLQATALINEAYLALGAGQGIEWQSRSHFFGLMARVMRRVLVDHARRRGRDKRGGGMDRISLGDCFDDDESGSSCDVTLTDLVALDEALVDLVRVDPQKAKIVELRFFGGLNIEETAEVLGVSKPTVVRQWRLARAWLYSRLNPQGTGT